MTLKLKQFISDNKFLLFLLPFSISWCIWVTNGQYVAASRDKSIEQTVQAQDQLNAQALNTICSDMDEIKGTVKEHRDENLANQKEMRDLIFDLIKLLRMNNKSK